MECKESCKKTPQSGERNTHEDLKGKKEEINKGTEMKKSRAL